MSSPKASVMMARAKERTPRNAGTLAAQPAKAPMRPAGATVAHHGRPSFAMRMPAV